MKKRNQRPAIAMIELIFAIVVMGIALLSAPTLISVAKSSINVTLQQEGINEAEAEINNILTYSWDEEDTNDSCTPPVLNTLSPVTDLADAGNGRRAGVPQSSKSRTFFCGGRRDLNASIVLGSEGGDLDDIDDFTGTSNLVQIQSGGTDYVETSTVNIAVSVNYIADTASYSNSTFTYAPPSGAVTYSTSIKQISVTLTSTAAASTPELNKNIVLKAFSCNIGGAEYKPRIF